MIYHTRLLYPLLLSIILVSLLAGCTIPAATPNSVVEPTPVIEPTVGEVDTTITITDTLGNKVSFDQLPERIVVAGKATPLLVNTLYMFPEAVSRITTIENRSQSPEIFIPLVDATYADKLTLEKNAGPEAIAPAQPDVVILKPYMKEKLGDPLETIGIKVIYLDLETPDTFYKDLQTIGALFGNSQRADELTAFYQSKVQAITGTIDPLSPEDKPGVLLLKHSDEENVVSYEVPPANYLQTMLVEMAGGTPLWKDSSAGDGWQTVTLDQIAAWDPARIAVINYSGGAPDAIAAIQADATWQQLKALQTGHLGAFPMDYLSWDQPDPRWILGLTWLASFIHPDQFPGYDPELEVMDFYRTVYGLDKATIATSIFPLMVGSLLPGGQ
ncbi:MAG: ABC transporter substrate-binding protein [Anaerolineaceae bacterium]|nr:ABC transporter substrate-binding protein [Anaerolineaceae bacterium]